MVTKKEIKTKEKNTEAIKSINTKEKIEKTKIEVLREESEEKTNQINKKKINEKNPTYLFFKGFIKRIKEDKLYLFSLIITIAFFGYFSIAKMQSTEGYYDRKEQNNNKEQITTPSEGVIKNPSKDETPITSDDLDVNDYVGIYSREINLAEPIKLTSTCETKTLTYVYEIKKDKTINKYVKDECIGSIKLWSNKLSYVSTGGARYISANNINYLFSSSSMKEIDGDTYKMDESIDAITENKKISSLELYYKNNSNLIFNTQKDLILIKGNNISFELSKEYITTNSNLEKTVSKTSKENVFKFISYENKDSKQCFTKEELNTEGIVEQELYKIYTIKYNEETGTFNSPNEIVSRKNTETCDVLKEDIASLNE